MDYVTSSAVRERVLKSLRDRPATSRELCDRLPGSESGIYAATTGLSDRLLIERTDGKQWHLTGLGTVVADGLCRQRRLEAALAADREYWRSHDVTVLPAPFRGTLHALAECEIVRATAADPQRVVRFVRDRVASADGFDGVTPVFTPDYETALTDVAERCTPRIVVDPSVVEEVYDGSADRARIDRGVEVRALDVDVAMGVVDDALLLSLPTRDGEYDLRTELVSTGSEAVEWGEHLFEWYWNRATPLDAPTGT